MHQFGRLAPGLTPAVLRTRLVDAGFIVLVAGGRYAETPKMRKIPRADFDAAIREVLNG